MRSEIERQEQLRQACFIPCKTMHDLRRWIKVYLGVALPFGRVDPESNSSPMEFVWEVYELAMRGGDENLGRLMAYAARDSMKCVEKGTKLLTRNGLKNIEDVKVGEEVWSGWAWRRVTNWIHDGVKEAVRARFSDGRKLTVSPIHRVWAWEPGQAEPTWKKVSELTLTDRVAVDAPQLELSHSVLGYEQGYVCGLLAGDGCTTLIDDYGKVCLSTSDQYVLGKWKQFCWQTCGRLPSSPKPKRPYDYWIDSVEVVKKLRSWGVEAAYSYEKTIPSVVFESTSGAAGFVAGLLDTDGTYDKTQILLQLTSADLIYQTQVLLTSLGIHSQTWSAQRLYGMQRHVVHFLSISSDEFARMREVGIEIRAHKNSQLRPSMKYNTHDNLPMAQASGFLGSLPNKGGRWTKRVGKKPRVGVYPAISRSKLKDLLRWSKTNEIPVGRYPEYFSRKWVQPVSVEKTVADFYDLTVEHDHSYWSDGFISHNTLATAILEVLMLVHCGRNVVHVAAQEDQAAKAQEYVKDFLERPILRDYKVGDNARTVVYVRYQRKTDKSTNITVRQWKRLSDAEKNEYQPVSLKIEIAICTLKGLNGKHSTFLVMDEIDIIGNPRLYEEAKMIVGWRSGPSGGGGLAITVMVSTRKTVFGFVQKEIDEAPKTKLAVKTWNLIDVSERCSAERHLPMLPKIPIYHREDTLEAISEDAWKNLAPAEQERWTVEDGYQGCLQNCRLFAACLGRLATAHSDKRKPCGECGLVRDVHGKMVPRVHGVGECALKPISHTVQKITEVEASTAIAQLLCRKPPTSGLVYPRLDDQVHCLTADQLVNLLKNGDPNEGDAHRTTKEMLIEVLREEDCTFVGGMDFGDTHNFAAVTGAAVGKILIVFDYLEVAGLETNQQVDQCERLKKWRPKIYPDMAGKSSIKIFRKAGFEMREWRKGAGSVLEGIDIVKAKCRPTNSVPEIYFLRDDEWVMRLFKKLARYRWKQALDGTYTNVPDDKDDDGADAFRYMVMNVFPLRNTRTLSVERKEEESATPKPPSEYDQIWSLVKMQQPDVQQTSQVVKKGRFKWIG